MYSYDVLFGGLCALAPHAMAARSLAWLAAPAPLPALTSPLPADYVPLPDSNFSSRGARSSRDKDTGIKLACTLRNTVRDHSQ